MENKEICDQVIEILNSIGITTNVTDMETDIDINELISDSIQWISFIISLEDKFGIEWPDDFIMINNFISLKTIICFISDMLNEKGKTNNA